MGKAQLFWQGKAVPLVGEEKVGVSAVNGAAVPSSLGAPHDVSGQTVFAVPAAPVVIHRDPITYLDIAHAFP